MRNSHDVTIAITNAFKGGARNDETAFLVVDQILPANPTVHRGSAAFLPSGTNQHFAANLPHRPTQRAQKQRHRSVAALSIQMMSEHMDTGLSASLLCQT